MSIDLALVGATGLVGEAILEQLAHRDLPVGELFVLASENSEGKSLRVGKKSLQVRKAEDFDFSRGQLAGFAAAGTEVAVVEDQAGVPGCGEALGEGVQALLAHPAKTVGHHHNRQQRGARRRCVVGAVQPGGAVVGARGEGHVGSVHDSTIWKHFQCCKSI